jgi:hypothetical protein
VAGGRETSDGLRGCGRLYPDAERGQQMLMQLGEFGATRPALPAGSLAATTAAAARR